jgi:hypothetical protein
MTTAKREPGSGAVSDEAAAAVWLDVAWRAMYKRFDGSTFRGLPEAAVTALRDAIERGEVPPMVPSGSVVESRKLHDERDSLPALLRAEVGL